MRSPSAGASPFGAASFGMTASNPFSISLLETTAVLRHVTGSPGLGLLRRLRPVPDRSADGVPNPWPRWRRRPEADQGRFPCSLIDRSTEEAPDSAPATSPWLPRSTFTTASPSAHRHSGEFPAPLNEGGGCASPPAQIRQVRAGASLRGVERRFLAYAFPPRSPHPRRLAVPTRHGFVGAACHPSRHLPRPAAPSFTALLRQDGGEGLSPPLNQQAPHGAPAV